MLLTIFTPIYNREKYVPRLFDTLLKQKCKNFEWIIIDDGSSDATKQEINKELKKQKNDFPITFLTKQNGGKQRAINDAVSIAKGKYFFILDSDDVLLSNATELIDKWCKEIENLSNYNEYAGVSGLCITPQGKYLSGVVTGKQYIDASNLDRYKFNLEGDMAEVYKTTILRRFPFKVFPNETFISEETVWNEIANNGYIMRWYMTPIYVGDYLVDGLTKNSIQRDINNYTGLIYQTKEALKLKPLKKQILSVGYFVDISKRKGYSLTKMKSNIKISKIKLFVCFFIWKVNTEIKS